MRYALVAALSLVAGYYIGRDSHQNVNELQRAGFIVLDPECYECEKFDEGILADFPSYWTTQEIY